MGQLWFKHYVRRANTAQDSCPARDAEPESVIWLSPLGALVAWIRSGTLPVDLLDHSYQRLSRCNGRIRPTAGYVILR